MRRIICFDLGWTLEDESEAQLDRAIQVSLVCKNHGVEVDPDEILELQVEAGRRGIASVHRAALDELDLPPAALADVQSRVRWNTARLTLYDGAADLLRYLARDHRLVLIANQSQPIDGRLAAYGIARHFHQVLYSCEVGVDKPDPAIFRLAMAPSAPGSEFWMVGDRIDNDIVPAKTLGWKTIRIRQGDYRLQDPKPAEKADFEVGSLAGVAAVFNRLANGC
jgi:FMN phosphatase YigB (HAD superfamily)